MFEELGWPSSSQKRSCAARRKGSNGGPSGELDAASYTASSYAMRSPFWYRRFGSHCIKTAFDRRCGAWDGADLIPKPKRSYSHAFRRKRPWDAVGGDGSSSASSAGSATSSHSPLMYPMMAR